MNAGVLEDVLHERLFTGAGDVYAVLDGRKIPGLPERLRATGAEFWCLLAEGLDPVLAECAPYLVRLHCEASAVAAALRAVWERGSGIVLCTRAGSDGRALRGHLRAWLRIPGADGRTQFFRFYDPRVLRAILPGLSAERRAEFLTPLGCVYVSGPTPGSLIEFCRDASADGRALGAADESEVSCSAGLRLAKLA
ncbi:MULTISPECIES: DUF4123 domain-containing protein [unclassified Lysobacter]|uniref:DUF4123 domain-containing protein n=1 Tax=unclassified Lysobacter TaxID=2635362 RepID=UPI001BE89D04|nr:MULTISPECIES: DUF4123 domain-containing protein [unclassified Lysobacter]MBT2744844.1 DUF4123 domain-containing protein [Lysobacter sp. ISL-42]MBT2752163.1 DUF4123 domain-containing protein [Lysobacter sp. ISL-50]MBT2778660.1 DUF4123 domain-containing protein [Lysobacter sp. ISL-54]MBT2780409.1 DUF4123 domain-containing protein [Lysobacter sp. ISL-52]